MSFIFAQEKLVAAVDTTIKTIGANNKALVDITICKTTPGNAVVNISVTVGGTTTFLEHDVIIPYGTPLVRTREMFPPGAIIKVEADTGDVDVTLVGVEEVV